VIRSGSYLAGGVAAIVAFAMPALAKDSLGVFESWGAFRDADTPRCYAISEAENIRGKADYRAFLSVSFWPKQQVRGQVHFRLSREKSKNARVTASISGRRFTLTGGSADVWAQDKRMDAAIVAAIRSARSMSITTLDRQGKALVDTYALRGSATAIDAATLGCSRLR